MRGLLTLIALASLVAVSVPVAADHVPTPPKTAQELTLYHTWPQLTVELRDLAAAHPDLMSIESIGTSVLGLDLWGVHLFAEQGIPIEHREKIYLDGGIHANEQLGMELALAFVHYLVDGYGTDENATWILENRDVFIVPMVNPDGNMRDTRINTHLVDLNRNFPYGWGGPGSGDMPGGFTYRGPAPASEPETQAVMAAIRGFDPDYSQSYHTGTTMFLFPWGGNETKVDDHPIYQRICEEINATDPEDIFPCGPVFTTIYPATGGTVD
ncbi:MAG: M14 family zinc carboxypeptidase, partial [Candidatus Rokuibacteriota bacterium]